jgi:hypothetical protein
VQWRGAAVKSHHGHDRQFGEFGCTSHRQRNENMQQCVNQNGSCKTCAVSRL